MTVILTTSPGFGKHGRVPERLKELGWELIRCVDTSLPDGGVSAHIARADYMVVGLVPVTAQMLEGATKLKAVLKHGVGVDNIDIPACTARGLPVANTPGANADAVAELAVGMMLSLARNIPAGHQSVVTGGWDRKVGSQIGGKTLGIVGLGNIGRSLARMARGMGMTVVATDPYADKAFAADNGIELVDLDDLLGRADYVSLHVFGGAGNASLINADKLRLMKPTARLLNLARGEVVDLDALAEALNEGRLGGAGIDAYIKEPPETTHPIFSHPRVVFMPHSGADTVEAVENVGLMNIADIEELMAGGKPRRVLNPDVFES
ncbi:phosphoglycerate dehydrogenase [Rhizobium sp. NRK18]|uniref:phosphoglycerate dehydrogenase n=1 Tax=Rhizobium sp. NRK18 TaxID=2964667 RepID=UPI0021C353DB|nr:phosphoglycerate dehydrogenase [Rhizobium sp. NRK18]MCQ2006057.1 phosphoglycerate dehydrogenase [Rhizobium sp. NRK18]